MTLIPDSHKDLLERPVIVSLATVLPDGQPHVTPVWIDYDGELLHINSAAGRQKDKDMRRDAKVTILAIDPDDGYRWMEVRGDVIDVFDDVDMINKLSLKYRGEPDYFARNPSRRNIEQRVTYTIRPTKVTQGG